VNEQDKEKVVSVKVFVTNDLPLAAYLLMHRIKLIDARRLGTSYKFSFKDEPRIQSLQYQYVNSDCAIFDDAIRKLKKLLFAQRTA